MNGLLIVNADDWGGFRAGTDAIERCFEAGAITSATAMMWMADSERAAELAVGVGRPIGLHLNLTQPFDGPDVPATVAERQRRLCAHFSDLRIRRWTIDPRPATRRLVRDAVADQIGEFHRLYGGAPTHIDGHHHAHVSPDVLVALPRGVKIRQTLSGTAPHVRAKSAWISRRFVTTDRFRYFEDLTGPADLAESRQYPVEVMCHPSFEHELPQLLRDDWIEGVKNSPHGTYRDLSRA